MKSSVKVLLNNKISLALTVFGLGIGLFVLAVGIEAMNAYTEKELKRINDIDRNACMIYSSNNIDVGESIYKLKQNKYRFSYTYYKKAKDSSKISFDYKKSHLDINISLIGASYDFQDGCFCYTDEESNYLGKPRLLYGDFCSYSQYQNEEAVCVLEKSTSELLFGKENSVGKKIVFEINDVAYEFVVIAVIDDFPVSSQGNLKTNASIRRGEDLIIQRDVIVPLRWYRNKYEISDRSLSYVVFEFQKDYLEKSRSIIETCNYGTDNVEIINYESMFCDLLDFIEGMTGIMNLVLVLVFLLSGMIIMNTMFFSIKERIREIGIRRAIGANSRMILQQIVLESILVGIVSFFITILFTNLVFSIVSLILLYVLGIDYIISLHVTTCGILFLIAIIESISFSVLPGIYATRIKPVDAILFN